MCIFIFVPACIWRYEIVKYLTDTDTKNLQKTCRFLRSVLVGKYVYCTLECKTWEFERRLRDIYGVPYKAYTGVISKYLWASSDDYEYSRWFVYNIITANYSEIGKSGLLFTSLTFDHIVLALQYGLYDMAHGIFTWLHKYNRRRVRPWSAFKVVMLPDDGLNWIFKNLIVPYHRQVGSFDILVPSATDIDVELYRLRKRMKTYDTCDDLTYQNVMYHFKNYISWYTRYENGKYVLPVRPRRLPRLPAREVLVK